MGRTAELTQLHGWLAKALQGERQLVFVTGEPGIGKTALIEAFRQRLETGEWRLASSSQVSSPQPQVPIFIGHGQCIEHYGTGEAYLPILEALGRLCREPDGRGIRAILAQYAPTWLVQMPSLLTTDEATALQGKTAGATRTRMLRELAEAIEEVTAERPLVLWLEDLHWSDMSTLDWLAFIARRREAARLLVLGTYRPVEVLAREHPLKTVKQELYLHGQCQELIVDFLREEHVSEYLMRRFAVGAHDRAPFYHLARAIHQRTDGNPLFMVNTVDQLMSQGVFVQVGGQWTAQKEEGAAGAMPESLRQMIEQQVERLNAEERQVLEAASVAGVEFSAAAVAAGMGTELDAVEERCTRLARREQFLRFTGTNEWPDGTVAARYQFLHALYQEVLYERLPAGRQQRLHQRIGEREEQASGERVREIAAELAMHFERGRDYRKAVQYLQQAGENALRRSAHTEAIHHFTRGIALLKMLPDTDEYARRELALQINLGVSLMNARGYASPEMAHAYSRAQELCRQIGEPSQLFQVLAGLFNFYEARAELQTARPFAEHFLSFAQQGTQPALLVEAYQLMGLALFYLGDFPEAKEHLEQGITLYDPQPHGTHAFFYGGADPGVACHGMAALTLWYLGYPDQGLEQSYKSLTLAETLSHPFSLVWALYFAASVHLLRHELQAAQAQAEKAVTLATDQGFPHYAAMGTVAWGAALANQGQVGEGIELMRQGVAAYRAVGAKLGLAGLLALQAKTYGQVGQAGEGLALLAEAVAVVQETGGRVWHAELYRLKGELTLQQFKGENPQSTFCNPQSEAEACFLKAIEVAQRQQANSWELRATMSLARLWQQQGKMVEAHRMLSEIYGWFTEGFDTADLQEAKALLEELA